MTVFFYYLKLNWVGPGDINGYDLRFFLWQNPEQTQATQQHDAYWDWVICNVNWGVEVTKRLWSIWVYCSFMWSYFLQHGDWVGREQWVGRPKPSWFGSTCTLRGMGKHFGLNSLTEFLVLICFPSWISWIK